MSKPRSPHSVTPPPAATPRGRIGLAATFLLGFVMAFFVGAWSSGPDGPSDIELRVAELEKEEAKRDVAQIVALNDLSRGSRDRLAPVVTATATPTAADVATWRGIVTAEAERYATSPSMGNGVNVARTGFRTAVAQLGAAVATFEAALTAPEPLRGKLLTLAAVQRTNAVQSWAVAALQLDVVNVQIGKGHLHVQFQSAPDSEPEGSGRR